MSFTPLPVAFVEFLHQLKSNTSPRILDLGSGMGDFSNSLAEFHLPVWGLDRLPPEAGVKSDLRGDALSPPFLPESLDCILAGNLVRHLLVQDRTGLFLQKWFALLRPGGSIFIFEDEPSRMDKSQGNFADLQQFLAKLVPQTRGPLMAREIFHEKVAVWTPCQKWVSGLEVNETRPDIASVRKMLSGGMNQENPDGEPGRLLNSIEDFGMSYGSYWWASTQKV